MKKLLLSLGAVAMVLTAFGADQQVTAPSANSKAPAVAVSAPSDKPAVTSGSKTADAKADDSCSCCDGDSCSPNKKSATFSPRAREVFGKKLFAGS